MNFTWNEKDMPPEERIGPAGWGIAALRMLVILPVMLLGVIATLGARLIERPFVGAHRPCSARIVQWFARFVFLALNMRHEIRGQPMSGPGAVVANHSSWLDIFALNARHRVFFVSKSEVAGWPGIGFLATMAGTLYIKRDRREVKDQTRLMEARLQAGHRLLFFPEGTSSDGRRILPFKSTLFQTFFNTEMRDCLSVQPVTILYTAPKGRDSRFYGWWGDMEFGGHALKLLAAWPQGGVHVMYHPPVRISDFKDRKNLSAYMETCIRNAMPESAS